MRMLKRTLGAGILLVLMAALAPGAGAGSASAAAPAAAEAVEGLEGVCAPPCGWINPLIDLDFPEKPSCGGGVVTAERPDDCIPLMADGERLAMEGTLTWYWSISDEAHYPNDPQQDIEVSFGGTASNPSYLDVVVEPERFIIDTATLFSPEHMHVEEGPTGQQQLVYRYEEPVTVTFTREGSPDARDLERLHNRDGIQSLFLKASSTESGERFKAAFGVEEFRFDATKAPDAAMLGLDATGTKDTPGPALPLLVAALALAALTRRR